jgi:hypothetical protein
MLAMFPGSRMLALSRRALAVFGACLGMPVGVWDHGMAR